MPAPARVEGQLTFLDALDRVLDKGVVVDNAARCSVLGLEVGAFQAKLVVAGIDTYLAYANTPADCQWNALPRGPPDALPFTPGTQSPLE